MGMKRIRRAVATVGQYSTPDGKTKNRYQNVGTLFKRDDDGSLTMKVDAIPAGSEWNGWVNFYPIDDKKPARPKPEPQAQIPEFEDDDIPF